MLLRERFLVSRYPVGTLPRRSGDHDVIDLVEVGERHAIAVTAAEHRRADNEGAVQLGEPA